MNPATAQDSSLPATEIAAPPAATGIDWSELADRVLSGEQLTEAEALAILTSPDDELLDIMAAAYRVRRKFWGKSVQLYFLMNAKSGLCPEDCSYCSQSKVSEAEIPKYNFLSRDKILDGARMAAEQGSKTYCIVISARGPSEREMQAVEQLVPQIKAQYELDVCACLGLLTPDQAVRLKACGVDTVNHNLNTSESYYNEICSTHTYQDRVETLKSVRAAGLKLCSGGIIGMGEQDIDVVRMAFLAARVEGRVDSTQLLEPHRWYAARRFPTSESPLLPQDARAVPLGQSAQRDSDRGWTRTSSRQPASPRTVCR
jgi:biotin synthase